MKIIALILVSLAVSNLGNTCLTSSDEYAVEVIVNNYNAAELSKFSQIVDRKYLFISQYNPNLIVVAEENVNPRGLSIRLQIPTEKKEIKQPYLKILSNYASGTLRKEVTSPFFGWAIVCGENTCNFAKNDINIKAMQLKNIGELTFEIKKELKECDSGCSGRCLALHDREVCIDKQIETDIDRVLKYANITKGIDNLFNSYRVVSSEGIVVLDIVPSYNFLIDWEEALREELVFLKGRGVIDISNEDIENAVSLAIRGQAGDAYSIVYDELSNSWTYSNKIQNLVLTTEKTCKVYSITRESAYEKESINLFYLVPIILTVAAAFLFLLLMFIANIVRRRNRKHRNI